MATPPEYAITTMLRECTESSAQARTYLRHLGLHSLSQSKIDSCRPKFSGVVQNFNKATNEAVVRIADKYESRRELQQVVLTDRQRFRNTIEPCLQQFGTIIWNDGHRSPPFMTSCDEHYPKHLIYENPADRERIRLYTFCWIIQRACRRITDLKRPLREPTEDSSFVPDSSDESQRSRPTAGEIFRHKNPNQVGSIPESARLPNQTEDSRSSARSASLDDLERPRVSDATVFRAPEAPRVSQTNAGPSRVLHASGSHPIPTTLNTSTCPHGTQRQDERSRLWDSVEKDDRELSTDSERSSIFEPDCIRVEPAQQTLPSRKRQLSAVSGGPGTTAPTARAKGKLKAVCHRKRGGPSSEVTRLTQPQARDEVSDTEDDATPDVVNDSEYTRGQGVPGRGQMPARDMGIQRDNREVNAIRDAQLERQSAAPIARLTAPQGNRPTLIVKLKLSAALGPNLRPNRKRLARELFKNLNANADRAGALDEAIKLIRILIGADSFRLRDIFAEKLGFYENVIRQWLDLVHILVEFQHATDTEDNTQAWTEHFKSLQDKPRRVARQAIMEASCAIDIWRSEQQEGFDLDKFSSDVAHVLVNMAEWICPMEQEDMDEFRGLVLGFNGSLLEWFA